MFTDQIENDITIMVAISGTQRGRALTPSNPNAISLPIRCTMDISMPTMAMCVPVGGGRGGKCREQRTSGADERTPRKVTTKAYEDEASFFRTELRELQHPGQAQDATPRINSNTLSDSPMKICPPIVAPMTVPTTNGGNLSTTYRQRDVPRLTAAPS